MATRTEELHVRISKLIYAGCSQDAHDLFGETLGVDRADRLLQLWINTYDNRSNLDKLYGNGRTKQQSFTAKAERDGYTPEEIRAFLTL